MLILAHRGLSDIYPENTLTAFRKAYETGADGVELDVRMTRDGKIVVFHDEDLKRMAGRSERISDMDYRDLLRINIGGEKIPLLSEVLDIVPENKWLNVEIKDRMASYPSVDMVVSRGLSAFTVFSSFDHELLEDLMRRFPSLKFGYLIGEEHRENSIKLIEKIVKNKPFSVHVPYQAFQMFPEEAEEFCSFLKDEGIRIFVWTLNDIEFFRKIEKFIDGVITDKVMDFVRFLRDGSA
ncbi:MAG: glycerophosphodiester phosphodiesterase [Thermotogae bacterium]|nr:MAG: glycerophosphodiester phosphodiesterase [Thermotogota bacterium]